MEMGFVVYKLKQRNGIKEDEACLPLLLCMLFIRMSFR